MKGNVNKAKKSKKNRIISICLAVGLVWGGIVQHAFAAFAGENVKVSGAVQANFKYEKTIDLTNGDRTKVPNADFNFTLEKISEGYMLNKIYKTATGRDAFEIVPGNLPNGGGTMLFSTVKFRSTDTYDATLTSLLDNYAPADVILNHIIKYSWGEMRSDNHMQTIIAREPNKEEKELHEKATGNGWPADTVVWRCFAEDSEGGYEGGCQSMLDYPFEGFDPVLFFSLRSNPAVSYFAYTFKRPLISRVGLGADGLYDSVSKPIMTTDEYHELVEKLSVANIDGSGKRVFRFLLKEDSNPNDEYVANQEVKIVDFIPDNQEGQLMMFNSLEEADRFYAKAANHRLNDSNNWEGSYFTDMVPRAGFTNQIKPKTPPTEPKNPPVEPNTPPVKPKMPLVKPEMPPVKTTKLSVKPSPRTSDNNMGFLYT